MEHKPQRAKALAQLAVIWSRVGSRDNRPIIASLT
jgi:hypothetical protein